MNESPNPRDELARLGALQATGLLDSEHEAVFDAIVALAASICGVPIAAISLIDTDRQWFKASVGLDVTQTSRGDSFCSHTILDRRTMQVPDTLEDSRFRENRLVLGDPRIRFYAGVPLFTSQGHGLGALCVIDRVPRALDAAKSESLRYLGTVVERLIEARAATNEAVRALARNHDFIRNISDAMPALVLYVDLDERVRFANAEVGRRFGLDSAELVGGTFLALCGATLYAELVPFLHRALSGEDVTFDGRETIHGQEKFYRSHYLPDRSADGALLGAFAMTFDLTEQVRARLTARSAERRLQLIADNVPAAISIVDRDLVYRFNNAAYAEWYGRPMAEITGHSVREVLGESVYAQVLPHLQQALAGERNQFEIRTDRGGEPKFLRGSYVPKLDDEGHVVGVFGLVLDQTALRLAEEKLRAIAEYDALTGLVNRYRLHEVLALSAARARRHGAARALLFLDIDRFKSINDEHGHACGDAALVEFAARLRREVRSTDTVARLAGDEFVVLLEGVMQLADAETVAQAIIAAMAVPVQVGLLALEVATSIGLAFSVSPDETADSLLHRADGALYQAKADGRNTWRVAADA